MMTRRNLHVWLKLVLIGVLAIAFYSGTKECKAADDALYTSLTQGIQALGEVDLSQGVDSLATYRNHADNRSRLDRRSSTDETKTERLSVKAQRILVHNLDPRFDGRREAEADIDVMSSMTPGKALAVIAALEDEKNFNGAALLASKFVDRQLEQDQQDLFCLIAARNIWLSRNKQLRDRYQELIDKARQSKNEQIAQQARLWEMAVKAPGSYDAICLSQQIWETLFFDLSDRYRSFNMSQLIGAVGPQLIDLIMIEEPDDELMEIQVAKIASFISEAGYQTQEGAWPEYAENIVTNMVYSDPIDLATITYYRGMNYFSLNRYETAAPFFEKVFISDTDQNIEFEAGYRLAFCQAASHNLVFAKATLNVLREWYPDNIRIDDMLKFENVIDPQIKEDSRSAVIVQTEKMHSMKLAGLNDKRPVNMAKILTSDHES